MPKRNEISSKNKQFVHIWIVRVCLCLCSHAFFSSFSSCCFFEWKLQTKVINFSLEHSHLPLHSIEKRACELRHTIPNKKQTDGKLFTRRHKCFVTEPIYSLQIINVQVSEPTERTYERTNEWAKWKELANGTAG